jgi:uncharacterized SAM-binding protein YcdF (DUF218 family)
LQTLRTALSALIAAAVLLALLIVADFFQRLAPTLDAAGQTRRAVVFTGQFDRIDAALALFDQGRIDQLLISGVGIGSGLRPETLADQFNFSPAARAALRSGDILLSPDAQDTACWLRALPPQAGVILISSVSHLPRASITLERALPPGIRVYRSSPPITDTDRSIQREELGKFILSWLASLTPRFRQPPDHLALCKPTPDATDP